MSSSMKHCASLAGDTWWYYPLRALVNCLGSGLGASFRYVWPVFTRAIDEMYGSVLDGGPHAKKAFDAHNEKIKTLVPKDRLLVYDVRQGWGPLCEFLAQPVPDRPMPNGNSKEEWFGRVKVLLWADLRECLSRLAGILVYGTLGVAIWRMGRE